MGNIDAKIEEEFLILSFSEVVSLGSAESENHFVILKSISKKDFSKLYIDFENCEGFEIYQDEIIEINFNFENELRWSSSGYCRVIKNGRINLKFNPKYRARQYSIFLNNYKPAKIKHFKKRICCKNEEDVDVCNITVNNFYGDYSLQQEEHLFVNDLSEYPENYCEEDCEYYIPFVSGYAKKQKDGSILIIIGEKRK